MKTFAASACLSVAAFFAAPSFAQAAGVPAYSPWDLFNVAWSGGYKDLGIPSSGALCSFASSHVAADEIIAAGIAKGHVQADEIDKGYWYAVRQFFNDRCH